MAGIKPPRTPRSAPRVRRKKSPGRPTIGPSARQKSTTIRLSGEDRRFIDSASAAAGETVSTFLLKAGLARAELVLQAEVRIEHGLTHDRVVVFRWGDGAPVEVCTLQLSPDEAKRFVDWFGGLGGPWGGRD